MVKRKSANGGCLGGKRRRRTWNSAKRVGELKASCDPTVSEWGNPHSDVYVLMSKVVNTGELWELKHLSTGRRRDQTRFSE
jgi:hypothetical protein